MVKIKNKCTISETAFRLNSAKKNAKANPAGSISHIK
jgi:hypothetical protein